MVHNHAEAIVMRDSVKLNLAMLEKAECILTGSKDIDNFWGLINKSRLQPTHKQEMTSVIMKMKRDRDIGQHLELEDVLNQIIAVFSIDDEEQHEALAAMIASAEQPDSRSGYRQKVHHRTRITSIRKAWHSSKRPLR